MASIAVVLAAGIGWSLANLVAPPDTIGFQRTVFPAVAVGAVWFGLLVVQARVAVEKATTRLGAYN